MNFLAAAIETASAGAGHPEFSLLGESPALCAVRAQIRRLASSSVPVAIYGESGSGKELAARDIHAFSPRSRGPFVPVNCGAIPESLMESEFFGVRRGAFTGATEDRPGFFHAAHRGTLFLDEIAELPLPMQVKLLRAIQEGSVRKLGAAREEPVDVRILCATHTDLANAVRLRRFRQDLYYRLNVIELQMPPLRERREDIPLLCEVLLRRQAASGTPVCLSAAALAALCAHDYPGNVRELENILQRAAAFATGGLIGVHELALRSGALSCDVHPEAAGTSGTSEVQAPARCAPCASLPVRLRAYEREQILQALRATRFRRAPAAGILGISLRQLRYRMQRLDIHEPE